METLETRHLNNLLDDMWQSHREYLRRLLIGLTRDIDLADDLLQETYIHARGGIAGYRGGDVRAWLTAIAKNAFRTHVRRPHVRMEMPLDPELEQMPSVGPHTAKHLTVMELRQAILALEPPLRTALFMKHYGGFTYKEIADHLHCAAGTAKWRVWAALKKLRSALKEEDTEMRCADIAGARMLDYLYGALPEQGSAALRAHMEECPVCREQAREMQGITRALDALEGDYKMMQIVEIDDRGVPTVYTTAVVLNASKRELSESEVDGEKTYPLDCLVVQGEEVQFEKRQSTKCEHRFTYTFPIPEPVKPGDQFDLFCAFHPVDDRARKGDDGIWRLWWGQSPGDEGDFVYIHVILLPKGATLVNANPAADELRSNGTTTLLWRRALAPNDQFECTVEYRM